MAARGYEFYLRVLKVSLTSERSQRVRDTLVEKVTSNSIVFTPRSHFGHFKRTGRVCEGEALLQWLIMLVTMATPISSHVKETNSMFTARGEDMTF